MANKKAAQSPDIETEEVVETAPKVSKPAKQNANQAFEMWKVDGKKEPFDKVKHIKDVAIPSEMAERLNENSRMSKVRYYAKQS